MRTRTMTAVLAATLLSAAVLSSCGSDTSEPDSVDRESSESGEQADDGGSEQDDDDDSSSPNKNKDVNDAAQAWLDASNKAMETLDPDPMLELSAAGCENCEYFADYLSDLEENGGRLEGDYEEVTRAGKAPEVDGDTATVTLTVERGPWSEVSEAGAEPEENDARKYDIEFDLKRENGSWIVTEMLPYTEE